VSEALLNPEAQGLPELLRGNFVQIEVDGRVAVVSRGFFDPLVQLRLVRLIFQENDVGPGIDPLRQVLQAMILHHHGLLAGMDDPL
jgi:hypothetical protein